MPVTIKIFASSGNRAVMATSCNIPRSLIMRTTRSPVLALVWNESERYWTCRYNWLRILVIARLPIWAKPIVCQYEARARSSVIITTARAAKASSVMESNDSNLAKKAGPRLEPEPMI